MGKFLDKTGFAYFWNIIKSELAKKADTNHSHNASDILGCTTMTKLWENASPTSAFAEQTISLDLSEYTFVDIMTELSTGDQLYKTFRIPVGKRGWLDYAQYASSNWAALNMFRACEVKTNEIYFNHSYFNTSISSARDNYVVPTRIYGIK